MIKNLIFDLDFTIIKDFDEDAKQYKKVLNKYDYSESDCYILHDAINEYNGTFIIDNYYYNKNKMLEFINKKLNKNYSIDFLNEILDTIAEYWIREICIKERTLKELCKKYNLYVYSDFFESVQVRRLEKIGYLKYFKKVYTADNYGCKKYKKSFEKILKDINTSSDECIFIGDSIIIDVLGANNVGMKAILYDFDGKRDNPNLGLKNYIVINNLDEMIRILC